jgi:hypothetical protein
MDNGVKAVLGITKDHIERGGKALAWRLTAKQLGKGSEGVNKARLGNEVKTEKTADYFHFFLKYTSSLLGVFHAWDDVPDPLPEPFPRLWSYRVWSALGHCWALKGLPT